MTTFCARCNEELPRSRVHVDGKEYHLHCYRTEADWRELDRLAEIAMQGLCVQFVPHMQLSPFQHSTMVSSSPYTHSISNFCLQQRPAPEIAQDAYKIAEAMLAERKRRRET